MATLELIVHGANVCLSVRLFVHCLLCVVYVAWVLEGWNLNLVGVIQAIVTVFFVLAGEFSKHQYQGTQ